MQLAKMFFNFFPCYTAFATPKHTLSQQPIRLVIKELSPILTVLVIPIFLCPSAPSILLLHTTLIYLCLMWGGLSLACLETLVCQKDLNLFLERPGSFGFLEQATKHPDNSTGWLMWLDWQSFPDSILFLLWDLFRDCGCVWAVWGSKPLSRRNFGLYLLPWSSRNWANFSF